MLSMLVGLSFGQVLVVRCAIFGTHAAKRGADEIWGITSDDRDAKAERLTSVRVVLPWGRGGWGIFLL